MHAQHFLIAERERSIYDNCCFDIGSFRAIRVIEKGVYIRVTHLHIMRSFAQEKKSQQAPEIDTLVRDRKVFVWCHKIN